MIHTTTTKNTYGTSKKKVLLGMEEEYGGSHLLPTKPSWIQSNYF